MPDVAVILVNLKIVTSALPLLHLGNSAAAVVCWNSPPALREMVHQRIYTLHGYTKKTNIFGGKVTIEIRLLGKSKIIPGPAHEKYKMSADEVFVATANNYAGTAKWYTTLLAGTIQEVKDATKDGRKVRIQSSHGHSIWVRFLPAQADVIREQHGVGGYYLFIEGATVKQETFDINEPPITVLSMEKAQTPGVTLTFRVTREQPVRN